MPDLRVTLATRAAELREHIKDPLFRNGYALIINTGLTGLLGFLSIVVASYLYSEEVVGYNGALVAGMQLLSAVTQLNLSSALLRFLPRAGRYTRRLLVMSFVTAIVCAIVVTTTVLLISSAIAPDDFPLKMSLWLGCFFVLAVAAYSVFNLQDAAVTGLRQSVWVPIENGIFGVVKIAALFVFVGIFGTLGIFASWAIPLALSLLPMNYLIFRKLVPRHIEKTEDSVPASRRTVLRYIAGDYTSSLFIQATTTLLPLLVVTVLGAKVNGSFTVVQAISTATDLIVINMAMSFTVEGSNDETKVAQLARATLRHTLKIVVPLVLFIVVAAPLIVRIFDDPYQTATTQNLLRLMVLASIPRVITAMYGGLARLDHKTNRVFRMTLAQAVILVGGSLWLMPEMGIIGVGFAAVMSQLVVGGVLLPFLIRRLRVG